MNKLIPTINGVLISSGRSVPDGKSQIVYNWFIIETSHPQFDRTYFFHNHSQQLYDWNFRVCSRFNLWIFRFLKNGTNNLLTFDDSGGKICSSEAFVAVATAGILRGLCSLHIKHNIFYQNKHGPDLELQNTLNSLSQSLSDCDPNKNTYWTFGPQIRLIDWCWNATSAP